jgi:prepilin-type N-terminal cleavage/methylation domain-containing protein/prepilin-type processing-associated H-X9-DG protein
MRRVTQVRFRAFTLIELLVVVAIIGILASLILPAMTRARRHSKVTVCLSNLHQMSVGAELFEMDNNGLIPMGLGGHKLAREFVCPSIMSDAQILQEMLSRPLYPYIKPSDVFACPEDKGEDFSSDYLNFAPSLFYVGGCSYQVNGGSWKYTKHPVEGTLDGKTSSWVPSPSKYIFLYEPPARPVWKPIGTICDAHVVEFRYYFHWHFYTGNTTITQTELPHDRQRFISPILFVDGHAGQFDFTRSLTAEPQYPIEETKDWMWYKAGPDSILHER